MKIKLSELYNSKPVFTKLTQTPLPVKASYQIFKFIKKINDELEIAEITRIELVKKYGIKEKDSDNYSVPKENIEIFKKEYDEFLNEEIEIVGLNKLKIDLIENVVLSVQELNFIIPFIDDGVNDNNGEIKT